VKGPVLFKFHRFGPAAGEHLPRLFILHVIEQVCIQSNRDVIGPDSCQASERSTDRTAMFSSRFHLFFSPQLLRVPLNDSEHLSVRRFSPAPDRSRWCQCSLDLRKLIHTTDPGISFHRKRNPSAGYSPTPFRSPRSPETADHRPPIGGMRGFDRFSGALVGIGGFFLRLLLMNQ